MTPERGFESLILSAKVEDPIRELVEEQQRSDLLHPYNMSPRNRILLAGPLGNGKTSLVEAIAFELMCPLFVIRYETDEIKRVVSSLLLQLDELPDYVVLAAASNHPELLDRAVWRRFQLRIELPQPSRQQLSHFIENQSARCKVNFGMAAETIAKALSVANFAEVEEFCLSVVRRTILEQKTENWFQEECSFP